MILGTIRAGCKLFLIDPLIDIVHPPKGQIPELDFLRNCAVVMVIFAHLNKPYLSQGGIVNFFSELPIVRGGRVGVDLFLY
jgi:peptidoglycan/LPS O-acetylase OafA/YrhL